ncbi:MAG: DUF4331 domain-containing protein [Pseudomonadota bacterium]|nr:DUF4331 domain-containing protein [Pseudomonadota bacterium]
MSTPVLPPLRRLAAPMLIASALAAAWAPSLHASSHREAPFIAGMPKVDGTDFYMFRSYEPGRDQYVVLVANYVPLQDPYGGPNYFKLDSNAVYEIHVNNDGGARENITFQFKFQNVNDDNKLNVGGKAVSIPLVQNGSKDVDSPNDPGLNVHERYSLNIIRGLRRTGTTQAVVNTRTGSTVFEKPVDNIGMKTIKNYIAYANKHVYDMAIPGCAGTGRVFVGQRKDPFVVNLGETFDLVNIKYPAVELNPRAETATVDNLADKNVTSIIMEVPTACLTEGKGTIIGGWTTASLPASQVLSSTPGSGLDPTTPSGDLVQVSRLGMPLVNEIVIGLKDKNKFNASEPKDDAQFADYVTNPTLPTLLEALFGSAGVKAPTNFPRTDLVAAFLTGVTGLNQPANVTASEMLRLNTAIAPAAKGAQNRLGVLGGDNAGFPNGRRPGDDVVDIELRVAMGVLCTLSIGGCTPANAPAGSLKYTDGAYVSDAFFANDFPFLRAPLPGSPNPNNAVPVAAKLK